MSSCTHCGAPRADEAALFCAYCGKGVAAKGPRLLEAISIETAGDEATPVIAYGALVPTSFSNVFSTATDRQETIQIHLLLGNAARASQSRTLANLVLPIRSRAPRGVPRVQLTVTVDARGALRLKMEEIGTDNVYERSDLLVPVSGA
jgi:molecular chaperone DnaK (HSP70)